MDLVYIQAEPALCQGANAANTGVTVCVSGNPPITGAQGVFMKRAKWPTFCLAVEVRRYRPLCHFRRAIARMYRLRSSLLLCRLL